MKRMFLAMLAGMMALGAMAQGALGLGGKFTVKGTFEGVGDSVFLAFDDLDSPFGQTYAVTGEMIEETFDIEEATTLYVRNWEGSARVGSDAYLTIPAIPGETVIISQDENGEIQLGGSQFYLDYNEARKSIEPEYKAIETLVAHLRSEIEAGTPEEQVMEEYQEKMPELSFAYGKAVMAYIKAHPDQDASAALVAEMPDLEGVWAASQLLTDRACNGIAAILFLRKFGDEVVQLDSLVGSYAPDFTLIDINGKPLALSSLQGKWVIIDFWGSWCGWCIKDIPRMKEYYAKYSDKMEILGVDCNDTVEKWKNAVKQYELPWLHVYLDMDDENADNPLELYEVEGFPTKVIINPEGVIANILVGEDPEFYEYLDAVLQLGEDSEYYEIIEEQY